MKVVLSFLCCLLMAPFGVAQDLAMPKKPKVTRIIKKADAPVGRAYKNGPEIETKREAGVTPHDVLNNMFDAMDKTWIVPAYGKARSVEYRGDLRAQLPAEVVKTQVRKKRAREEARAVDFDTRVEGVAAPNGNYRLEMLGDLGRVNITEDRRRTLIASDDFKSFSDTPKRARSKDANLNSYQSYLRRHLSGLRSNVLESGQWRTLYRGSGTYDGRDVHVIRIYKNRPLARNKKAKPNRRKPIQMNKLWTFWQDGSYEIWVYKVSKMPAVIFYTNTEDRIFANMDFIYDRDWLPKRIDFRNNSIEADGRGDIIFTYDDDKMLSGMSFSFDGDKGVSIRLDTTLRFLNVVERDAFRAIPPFGYRKINKDHLKLMILTQVSGGLLKLRKHGINFRNFKF